MGKASKWIRNFLVGKKEEKNKNQDSISSSTTKAILPKERQRWSFGRSAGVESSNFVLKSLKSFDSIVNSHKLTKALLEYKDDDQHHQQIESAKEIVAVKSTKSARQGPADLDAAATKIQAVFRSYLARRALHALRGLVKLQALVRGHLVRKRTTATLRCMHALISIQVRARVQRIRMADESQTHCKDRTAQRALVQHKQPYIAKEEVNISKKGAFFKNKTSSGYHPNSRRNKPVLLHYSPRVPISERDLQLRTSTTPSTSSSTCSRQNTPTTKTNQNLVAPFSIPLSMSYTDHLANQYPWKPSYMANTQSSRAKLRSQSEPKQRPKGSIKQKNRRSISNELLDFTPEILLKCSSPNVRANGHKNQHPWLMKLYRSTKGMMKESECENICVTSNGSNCKSVLVYEPPVNLY